MGVVTPKYWIRTAGAFVRVHGEDAFAYLQSQISQDLRLLAQKGVVYGLWLDRKGKIRADSFVLQGDGAYYLFAHGLSVDQLIEQATVNVIADDVTFEVMDGDIAAITVFGDRAAILAGDAVGVDSGDGSGKGAVAAPAPGIVALFSDLVLGSVTLVLKDREIERICGELEAGGCRADDGSAWCAARVMAGILEFPGEFDDTDLPQEVGYEFAVSYTKGCYLGQEVMARLKALGRPRNGLARIELESVDSVAELSLPADLRVGEETVGTLRILGGRSGLAVINRRRAPSAEGEVTIGGTGQRASLKGWVG